MIKSHCIEIDIIHYKGDEYIYENFYDLFID